MLTLKKDEIIYVSVHSRFFLHLKLLQHDDSIIVPFISEFSVNNEKPGEGVGALYVSIALHHKLLYALLKINFQGSLSNINTYVTLNVILCFFFK